MPDTERIRSLYQNYIETVENLEKNRKIGDGLLGLKGGPADDPCHEKFWDDLAKALEEFAAKDPASAEIKEALTYMFAVPMEHREPLSAFWMLKAVHGLTLDLIGHLSPADAAELLRAYKDTYPRPERLPAQKKVLAALKRMSQ